MILVMLFSVSVLMINLILKHSISTVKRIAGRPTWEPNPCWGLQYLSILPEVGIFQNY